jgi:hypothetical protein
MVHYFVDAWIKAGMDAGRFLDQITDDESLTDGLADEQAASLVQWTLDRAQALLSTIDDAAKAGKAIGALRVRARAISQAVQKICDESDPAAAAGLLGPRFDESWCAPLPADDPSDVLSRILRRESENET